MAESGGSTSHSSSSLSGGSGTEDQVNWKERCHTLEASLHKFKSQAAKIRELLAQKMQELEQRTQDAERRAHSAEEKNVELEEILKVAHVLPSQLELERKLSLTESESRDKDKNIVALTAQIEEQKQLRIQEAKLLEEKSLKIKDWVTKKIKDLELQNDQYRVEADTLRDQVETLRARLHSLPTSTARQIHMRSVQDSDSPPDSCDNISPPEIPERPSSSILETFRRERDRADPTAAAVAAPDSGKKSPREIAMESSSPEIEDPVADNMADVSDDDDFEPLYQEIDDNHQSKYGPKRRAGPPQVRIERKIFPNPQMTSSMISSTNGSEEMLDRQPNSPLLQPRRQQQQQHTQGVQGLYALPHQNGVNSRGCKSPLLLQPLKSPPLLKPRTCQSPPAAPQPQPLSPQPQREPSHSPQSAPSPSPHAIPHLSPLHQHPRFNYNMPTTSAEGPYATIPVVFPQAPPSSPSHSHTSSGAYAYPPTEYQANTDSAYALATMPRRKKDNKLQIEDYQKPSVRIYAGTRDDTATIPHEQVKAEVARPPRLQGLGRIKPPTPPMRRLPSWENRIYAVASAGLRLPDPAANRESCFPVTDGLYTDQMYEDLTVPVYTTLKGRAAQIRSTPFTHDSSSDSSDNEDTGVVMATTSTESESEAVSMAPSDAKTTSSAGARKQSNQSSSGATKRAVSSQSLSSETSSDYAVPPDEISINTSDSSDNSEPEHKLLKYTAENFHKDSLERCGYLTKLGGKVKNWKRRWFVLKNFELLYYKTPNDVVRKPQGYITLDGQTRITKTEGALTFELATSKRTYYLTADTKEDMDLWIRVLQNVLKKQAADRILGQSRAKEVMKGWIIKTKHGRSRRCWCVLMGKFFMYYKSPNDKTPLGQVHLRDAKIEEVDRSCDSETDSDDTSIPDYTLGILPSNQSPTYLMLPTKHEKDSWMYHLTVAAGGGAGKVGTEYEQLISKLMEVTGDPASVFWKHPLLLHTKEPLNKPLTSLPSEDLHQRAVDLFRSCHMFMNLAIDSPQIDYHVSLAQNILEVCLQHSELQNEIYCQLIKQTSRHPPQHKSGVQNLLLCGSQWFACDASPTSPTNSLMDLSDSKQNPNNSVFVQGWQLLAMCLSLFIPKQSILWYLKAHLQRNADPRTDHGKLAVFCQRALDRTLQNGSRETRPSRMEVLSILLRNPYHHSQPISIPVHFLNGTYQVVSFDGSTTVQEFVSTLNKTIHMRDCALSGFCLFTDDPAGQELEHCLKSHLKLCDVISKWEQAFLQLHSGRGRPDSSRTVKLTYKNRLYLRSLARTETDKERLLLTHQVNEDVVNGRFPLNKDLALELAALMAQIEYGNYRDAHEVSMLMSGRLTPPHSQMQLPAIMERFFPKRYKDHNSAEMRLLEQRVAEKWAGLRGRSTKDCVRIYLTVARKWPFFGAKLFSAKMRHGSTYQVWLAVQEDCISVLDFATLKPLNVHDFKSVVTFGGFKDDFMLSVNKLDPKTGRASARTVRLIFSMTKAKILEVTMLMTSYINSRGQQHKSGAGRGGGDARDTVRKSYTASQYSTLMHTFTKVSSTMEV